MSWREQAKCSLDTAAEHDSSDPNWIGTAHALRRCDTCPVRGLCAERMAAGESGANGFEGVAAGMVWRHGRPISALTRRTRKRWGLAAA